MGIFTHKKAIDTSTTQKTKSDTSLKSASMPRTKETRKEKLLAVTKDKFLKMRLTWYKDEIVTCLKTMIEAKVNNLNLSALVERRDIDNMLVRSLQMKFREAREQGYSSKEILECWEKVLNKDLLYLFDTLKK